MADISFRDRSFPAVGPAAVRRLVWTGARTFADTWATWRRRARERRELANLDYRTIRDLALNPGDVQFEASKPFWRA